MANHITGITDTTGAVAVLPNQHKTVCIVAVKGADEGAAAEETIFNVVSTADASTKWGGAVKPVELVKILIENGVTNIKGIIAKAVGGEYTTKADAYAGALSKLLVDSNIDIIISDETDATIHAEIKDHLDVAEAEDKFRYAVVGVAAGLTNSAIGTLATAINNKRVFMAGPNTVTSGNIAQLGIYTAAGLAALIATETYPDPALPMNGVEMIGFGGVERVLLKAEKDTLISAGVTPLYTSPAGRPTVYRLVTTYTKDTQAQNDPTWQEGTTIFIADDIMKSVQAKLRANYKRTKNVVRILSSIRTEVVGILETKQDLEIIENFNPDSVSVIKDPQDTYGALINYTFDVVTPLYTLTISQHMKI